MVKRIKEIIITSPSRLPLGFYGFDAHHGYKYGSMGLAINAHKTIISVKHSQNMVSDLPKKYTFPIPKVNGLDLSYSGLKTSFINFDLLWPPLSKTFLTPNFSKIFAAFIM